MADQQEQDKQDAKRPKIAAPCRAQVPNLLNGTVWDTVDIGDYTFRVAVARDIHGIDSICHGNHSVAAGIFNRALRIAVPQKLDARKRLDEAKTPEAKAKVVADLQNEILDIDLTQIRVAQPKAPPKVDVPKGTPKTLIDQLIAQGVQVNIVG